MPYTQGKHLQVYGVLLKPLTCVINLKLNPPGATTTNNGMALVIRHGSFLINFQTSNTCSYIMIYDLNAIDQIPTKRAPKLRTSTVINSAYGNPMHSDTW